jgi:phosphomannomutase
MDLSTKILLFDVDGTLCPSGLIIEDHVVKCLTELSQKQNLILGVVGGGTVEKIKWQLGDAYFYFKYIFAECGAIMLENGKVCHEKNMLEHCNRNNLNKILTKALETISQMPIIFHGGQLDFRKGLIYVSPPGMQATSFERNYFLDLDKKLYLREKLLNELIKADTENEFDISYGGAVGVAIHPHNWDKTQVLGYLSEEKYFCAEIHYYGDRCEPGGNDYPIYSHKSVIGHAVKDPFDTVLQVQLHM